MRRNNIIEVPASALTLLFNFSEASPIPLKADDSFEDILEDIDDSKDALHDVIPRAERMYTEMLEAGVETKVVASILLTATALD